MKLGSCGRFGAPFVSGLVVLAGLFLVPAAPAQAEEQDGPPRILVVGDSISRGYAGDYTWRYRLAKYFDARAVPFEFVGSKTAVIYNTNNYVDPGFDTHHFAAAGWRYLDVTTSVDGGDSPLTQEVRGQGPDVVILELGTNDMGNNKTVVSADKLLDRMKLAVTQIRAVNPALKIVVANVPSTKIRRAAADYGKKLPGVVRTLSTPSSPMAVADLNRGWKVATFTVDLTHLTPVGETFEAQRIAEALAQLGLGPAVGQDAIFNPRLTWNPSIGSSSLFYKDGKHAKISWDGRLVTTTRMDITYRLVNTNSTMTRSVDVVKGLPRPYWVTPKLIPGGTYQVSLRPRRGTMRAAKQGPKDVFVAPGRTLAAVRNLKAKAVARSVKLTWSKKAGATGYRVVMRSYTASGKPGAWAKVKSNTKATSLTVAVSSYGKKYEFQVRPLKYYKLGLGANVSVRTKAH